MRGDGNMDEWGKGNYIVTERHKEPVGPPVVPGPALSHGLDTDNLLKMVYEVLKSGTDYAWSLAANIRCFYNAVKTENDLSDLKKRVAALESVREAGHPVDSKKEEAM